MQNDILIDCGLKRYSCLCVLLGLINLLPSFPSAPFLEHTIVCESCADWPDGFYADETCGKVAFPANSGFSS